jgi:hypothetical protein
MSSRNHPPRDLGPVRFKVRLRSEPFAVEDAEPVDVGVGFLADVAAAHASAWSSRWTVSFGPTTLQLKLPQDLDCLEEFWVLLLELVDSDHGEWSLNDGARDLTMEAQVFGPDVRFEFTSESGRPRFGGVELPASATVRLRAVVAEGIGFLRQLLTEARRVRPELGDREELVGMMSDVEQLQEAVASLPATFKGGASG